MDKKKMGLWVAGLPVGGSRPPDGSGRVPA